MSFECEYLTVFELGGVAVEGHFCQYFFDFVKDEFVLHLIGFLKLLDRETVYCLCAVSLVV